MQITKQRIKAAILHVVTNDAQREDSQEVLDEASKLLAEAEPSIELVFTKQQFLRVINPGTLFGKGMVEQYRQVVSDLGVELVFIDGKVSPIQQRNLQKLWNCPVTDRTGVILRVFKRHAVSNAGRLQVQMAYLQYQRTRLVRCWKHLERQRGSTTKLSGPGEKQIELDRRLIDKQIAKLKEKLKKLAITTKLQKRNRKRRHVPLVALVGYTSAGKSTLLNQLAEATLTTAATPFTTLDSVAKRLKLPNNCYCLVSDTIGFVRDLPPQLISAFHTTLQDVVDADLIVHVQDLSSSQLEQRNQTVLAILHQLDRGEIDQRIVNLYNKADLPSRHEIADDHLKVSALSGFNCDQLLLTITERLQAQGFFFKPSSED